MDLARGLALACICVDHLPGNYFSRFTLHAYGFNDAAEVFVLIAGMSAGIAYWGGFERKGVIHGMRSIIRRMGQVYATHVLLVALSAALLWWAAHATGNNAFLDIIHFGYFGGTLGDEIWRVLTLRLQPHYLNILPLYVVFLALLPAAFVLRRLHWALLLAVSIDVWLLPRMLGTNLPSDLHGRGWYFNPFAWQLLFVVGLLWGEAQRHGQSLGRHRVLALAAALYCLFALAAVAPWAKLPQFAHLRFLPVDWMGSVDKEDMSPLRILNVLALAYLAVYFVQRNDAWLDTRVARTFRTMGRASLTVFAVGSIVDVVGWIIYAQGGQGVAWQFAMIAASIAIMAVTASGYEFVARTGWREAATRAVRLPRHGFKGQ